MVKRATVALTATPPVPSTGAFEVTFSGRARGSQGEDVRVFTGRWAFGRPLGGASLALQVVGGKAFTYVRGQAIPPGADPPPTGAEQVVVPLLFVERDLDRLIRQLGIDPEKRHLSLLGDVVCDVVGADSSDPAEATLPQLWLDHDTFVPMRVVFRLGGPAGQAAHVDLTGWGHEPDGVPFPRQIRIFEGTRWVRALDVDPARRLGP